MYRKELSHLVAWWPWYFPEGYKCLRSADADCDPRVPVQQGVSSATGSDRQFSQKKSNFLWLVLWKVVLLKTWASRRIIVSLFSIAAVLISHNAFMALWKKGVHQCMSNHGNATVEATLALMDGGCKQDKHYNSAGTLNAKVSRSFMMHLTTRQHDVMLVTFTSTKGTQTQVAESKPELGS